MGYSLAICYKATGNHRAYSIVYTWTTFYSYVEFPERICIAFGCLCTLWDNSSMIFKFTMVLPIPSSWDEFYFSLVIGRSVISNF